MSYESIVKNHYEDLNNMSMLLRNYIEIYRLLVSSTVDLHNTSVIKKNELKHAMERIDDVGDIIDDLLKSIKKCEGSYVKYCYLKNDAIFGGESKDSILTEIHKDIEYHNE